METATPVYLELLDDYSRKNIKLEVQFKTCCCFNITTRLVTQNWKCFFLTFIYFFHKNLFSNTKTLFLVLYIAGKTIDNPQNV